MPNVNPTDAPVVELSVLTIASLRTLPGGIFKHILVDGSVAAGDGGGGIYRWNSTDNTADNGATIIQPNSGGIGRWNMTTPNTALFGVPIPIAQGGTGAITAAAARASLVVPTGSGSSTGTNTGDQDASTLTFLQAGAGAVTRTFQNKERDVISVADFGMLPAATAATNTSALALIATAVNALGGATLIFPPGTYQVNGRVDSGSLCAFSSLTGLTILGGGAVIADQVAYAGTQIGNLFSFASCNNIFAAGLKITSENEGVNLRGITGFAFSGTCNDFTLEWEQTGGFAGCTMVRLFADPVTSRCANYKIRANLTNVHYGVTGQFSGDNGQVQLNTSGGFRDFFFYGAAHINIDINCKNPLGTSLIASFQGLGCSDISLNYHDRESTTHIDLARVQLAWSDQTAAIHRDIRFHFDIANVAGSGGTPFFSFDKVNNAGAADAVGRGHQLLGFEISGNSDTIAGCNHVGVSDASAFVLTGTPDVVKNVKVKDFICTGATVDDDWSFLAGALSDTMQFDHVNVGARTLIVGNGANGRVVFKDCVAAGFSVNRQGGSLPFGDTGAAIVLLDKKTASNSATIDFTTGISADFSEYIVRHWNVVPATDDSSLTFRVSEDGGGTFKAGGTDYAYAFNIGTDAATNLPQGSTGAAQIQIGGSTSSTAARGGTSGTLSVALPSGTTQDKQVVFDNIFCRSAAVARDRVVGAGIFKLDTNAINGFRFLFSAGNITSGTFALYGVRAS